MEEFRARDRFEGEVQKHFGSLLKGKGFWLKRAEYAPELFGNAYMDYASDEMRLRLVSDRGDAFAQVAPADAIGEKDYVDLRNVLNFLVPGSAPDDSFQSISKAFVANYSIVSEFLRPEKYSTGRQKMKAFYGEHPLY